MKKEIKKIISENLWIVEKIVGKISKSLPPNVDRDDLISEGVMGLIDAAQKFDYRKGVKFETWAEIKVKGAILDYMRKQDFLGRPIRTLVKRISEVIRKLSSELMRNPTDEEIAKELGMTKEEYLAEIERIHYSSLVSLDDFFYDIKGTSKTRLYDVVEDKMVEDPLRYSEISDLSRAISSALEKLEEKEKMVIKMYYLDDIPMKEIAKRLGLSESRISQIHTKALLKLRAELKNLEEEEKQR